MKKPKTSVAVVKKIDDDNAGSIFILANTSGINVPQKPEITKFAIIAKNIIIPK